MLKIRPVIVIGIGPQAGRTVQEYVRRVQADHGSVPAILPVIISSSAQRTSFRRVDEGIQYITLSSPVFDEKVGWPTWLPPELGSMPPVQRERTRAWMRAALLQEADNLQEFFLESVPKLSCFATVEELNAKGLGLAGYSEIDVYVIADLNNHLGSGIFVDVAYLISYVCQQLGLSPLSWGLLYLPSATSPAPAEEAIAYAALKELEYYVRGHPYDGEFLPESVLTRQLVPFNSGCCLLDSMNEIGYTLHDEAQQVITVSEWVYAMTFLDMATEVWKRQERRYRTATLRGKSRLFESLGLTLRYVPRAPLIDWGAARLGDTIVERILNAQVDVDPQKGALALVERLKLRADALESRIRQESSTRHLEDMLAPLHATGLRRIEASARQTLHAIREQLFPILDFRVKRTSAKMQREAREAVVKGMRITLEVAPIGGISFTHRFLDLLRDYVSEMQAEVARRVRRHRTELNRSLATVSETYYITRSAVMSIPPWPVAILSVIALLILPLFYGVQLIQTVIRPVSAPWGHGSLGILFVGAAGVLGFVVYRLVWQKYLVSEQQVRQIRERFELESQPLIHRAMSAVYGAAEEAILQAKRDLDDRADQLQAVSARFQARAKEHAHTLEGLASSVPLRSAVHLERAERFYQRSVPDLDSLIAALLQQIGRISDWQAQCSMAGQPLVSWLEEQIWRFGTRYMEQRWEEYGVIDSLTYRASESEIRQALERMFEHARPMWNCDLRFLRRAKTQRLAFIGVDTDGSGWSKLVGPVSKIQPGVIPIDIADPHTMVILNMHWGMPLFALRRIGEYRIHYADMLWHSKLPVHTTRTLALVDDLIPTRRRPRFATSSLFAIGLAVGIIRRDPDGRYVAPRDKRRSIRLSTQKERSVALMGLDAAARGEVQRQLGALVAVEGWRAVRTIVDEYVDVVPDLEDWEVKGILDFGRAYELADETA